MQIFGVLIIQKKKKGNCDGSQTTAFKNVHEVSVSLKQFKQKLNIITSRMVWVIAGIWILFKLRVPNKKDNRVYVLENKSKPVVIVLMRMLWYLPGVDSTRHNVTMDVERKMLQTEFIYKWTVCS